MDLAQLTGLATGYGKAGADWAIRYYVLSNLLIYESANGRTSQVA